VSCTYVLVAHSFNLSDVFAKEPEALWIPDAFSCDSKSAQGFGIRVGLVFGIDTEMRPIGI